MLPPSFSLSLFLSLSWALSLDFKSLGCNFAVCIPVRVTLVSMIIVRSKELHGTIMPWFWDCSTPENHILLNCRYCHFTLDIFFHLFISFSLFFSILYKTISCFLGPDMKGFFCIKRKWSHSGFSLSLCDVLSQIWKQRKIK